MYFTLLENKKNILNNLEFAYYFYIKNLLKIGNSYLTGKRKQKGRIVGKKIMASTEANKLLYEMICGSSYTGLPIMVARFGSNELCQTLMTLMIKKGLRRNIPEKFMETGKLHAGIFPQTQEIFIRFGEMMLELCKEVDLLGYWGFILMEEYFIKHYLENTKLLASRSLEPFQFEKPWTSALKGKKVLVIHPFEETILQQYNKRIKLFKNPDILPEFDLLTLKAVQSQADAVCDFTDWFEAFNYMHSEILKKEFDIAILGCGSYGFPLAAKIKQAGKKAIHLGGMTQLLFGIKGARWEASRPDIVALYNDNWVRPESIERPKGAQKVENAAYW